MYFRRSQLNSATTDGDYLTAYITNYANNTISQCVVGSENGSLSNCLVNSASTAQNLNQLSGPSGIVYYSTEGLLFVSNIQGSNLVQCQVDPAPYNLLYGCSSASNSNVSQPYGIAFDDATDVIYATIFQNNTVTACMYGGDGCVTFPQ